MEVATSRRIGGRRQVPLQPYCVFDKVRQVKQSDIGSNKRLGTVLQHIRERQREQAVKRSKSAPTRRGQRRLARERFRKTNLAAL
jgi:hypothetical protein